MARLGNILTISASKQENNDEKKWLLNLDMVEQQTGNILAYNYVSENELNGSIIAFDAGNVLYSKLRPNLNKVVLPCGSGYATSEMLPLRPNTDVLTREYLTAYLRSDSFVNWAVSKTAGAKMPRLGTNELLNKEMPLPSLSEQCHITSTLDKLNELISLRKQQLAKLDELVKSRFMEMFGDPIQNPFHWEEICITEVCSSICGGGTPPKSHPEYFVGNIPWVSPKDMKTVKIEDSIDHITEEAVENSSTNLVPAKSVLMVIRSGILKHSLPVSINTVPVTINQDMKAFIPNNAVTVEYLMYYFKAIEADVLSGVRGVTADNIDFKEFKKRLIMVPPLALQKKFSTFWDSVDKSALTIQQSLDKLEVLKKSLMQEYFG